MSNLSGTRRDVLRRGAAAIGAATIVSNAGCMGILGGGGGSYSQWLPEPGTLEDEDHYGVSVLNLKSLSNQEDEFDDESVNFEQFEERWAPADVDWEDVSMLLTWFQGVRVIEADYNKEDVIEDFEDDDYDDEAEYEGFTLMLSPNERRMAAVDGSAIVLSQGLEDPEDALEDIIDTKNGDEDRYGDDSDDFSEMTDELGNGDLVNVMMQEPADDTNVERGVFENHVGTGRVNNVNGDETDGTWVLVFEDEDDVDVGDVEDWVEASQDSGGEFENWEDVEVNASGRSVVVEGTIDTDEI